MTGTLVGGPVPVSSRARRVGKRAAVIALRGAERLGLHVLPRHFYSPVADRQWMAQHPGSWQRPASMAGVEWDLDGQARWLKEIVGEHLAEVAGFSYLAEIEAAGVPFRYGLVEGQVLHCYLRRTAPRRIVEVGSGASTALMAGAVARNRLEGRGSDLVAVDPFAGDAVCAIPGVEVVRASAQEVDGEVFASLAPGDLLFIDSSHAVKAGSELARLYLEVIPALPPGVTIHIHDIYLPYLYAPWVLEDLWDWQESTLLLALLTNNRAIEVLCSESALLHDRAELLASILPDCVPLPVCDGVAHPGARGMFPSSTWLRTR